jgi:biopolymer transport protein ExbD
MRARWTEAEDKPAEELHDINVTPFIDVMLVLLIIFMVAAPLATVDMPVDLPSSNAAVQPPPEDPVYVTLGSDLALSLGNEPVARTELAAALDGLVGGDRAARIFVRADRSVPYGEVMEVLNLLRDGGYASVALVGLESRAGIATTP